MSTLALDDVRDALLDRLESLAESLLGAPSLKRGNQWRFGSKGSLAVEMQGSKRGAWRNYEAGAGGGPFQLIQHTRGCGFTDALAWAKSWLGISSDIAPAIDPAWLAERAQRMAEAEAAAAAEREQRIAYARRLWAGSIAVADTVAERYLTDARKIPAVTRPDAVRFHAPSRALILAATDSDGALSAVQRVRLTDDARKIAGSDTLPAKQTNGVASGAVVRLPGNPRYPLLIAEGPETGLSVWVACAAETWITLGSVAGATPPDDRRVIVCRDDDPAGSPADARLEVALSAWRASGLAVRVATPWGSRRGDKSDFNDVMQAAGAAAVRARIAVACRGETP